MPLGPSGPGVDAPPRARVPRSGRSWPVASRMSVLLPAPLAPTSPVMPGRSSSVTWLTPMTGPYHLETWSKSRSGRSAAARAPLRAQSREGPVRAQCRDISARSPPRGSAGSSKSGIRSTPLRVHTRPQLRPAACGERKLSTRHPQASASRPDRCRSKDRSAASVDRSASRPPTPWPEAGKKRTASSRP